MYNLVTRLKWYCMVYLKIAKRLNLKKFPLQEKQSNKVWLWIRTRLNGGAHVAIYTDIKSWGGTPRTNTMWHVNYISIKKLFYKSYHCTPTFSPSITYTCFIFFQYLDLSVPHSFPPTFQLISRHSCLWDSGPEERSAFLQQRNLLVGEQLEWKAQQAFMDSRVAQGYPPGDFWLHSPPTATRCHKPSGWVACDLKAHPAPLAELHTGAVRQA